MPLKCTFKPVRTAPRHFTAKSAVRVACNAIANGASVAEIERGIKECSPIKQQKDLSESEVAQAAVAQLQANNAMLTSVATSLERMLAVLGILSVIGKVVQRLPAPQARVLGTAAVALRELVSGQLQRVQVMRAANDNIIDAIRRAAQNDPFFLRQAGG